MADQTDICRELAQAAIRRVNAAFNAIGCPADLDVSDAAWKLREQKLDEAVESGKLSQVTRATEEYERHAKKCFAPYQPQPEAK